MDFWLRLSILVWWKTLPIFALRSIVVTGGNKGQGLALCRRILVEQLDTQVFLAARDKARGQAAVQSILEDGCVSKDRIEWLPLDVTDEDSVRNAASIVQKRLGEGASLYGVVSNAGILWGYSLEEQFAVNAIGACRVMDHFLPLLDPEEGRFIVVSSGLGPLMHGFASEKRQKAMQSSTLTFDDIKQIMQECLKDESAEGLAVIGFPGGPFADAAPDFHKYGLAKMLADAYQLRMSRKHPNLRIYSCDPGLVYTDLILKMPRYEGKEREETGAQSPEEGVEAAMRLLFTDQGTPGNFHAMNKAKTELLSTTIDVKPTE